VSKPLLDDPQCLFGVADFAQNLSEAMLNIWLGRFSVGGIAQQGCHPLP
jgi:hypothetical protein